MILPYYTIKLHIGYTVTVYCDEGSGSADRYIVGDLRGNFYEMQIFIYWLTGVKI